MLNLLNLTTILRERLAELEHDQWVAWAGFLEQSENLSPERLDRWHKLYGSYYSLTEEQKDQGRQWAKIALGIIAEELARILECDSEKLLKMKSEGELEFREYLAALVKPTPIL